MILAIKSAAVRFLSAWVYFSHHSMSFEPSSSFRQFLLFISFASVHILATLYSCAFFDVSPLSVDLFLIQLRTLCNNLISIWSAFSSLPYFLVSVAPSFRIKIADEHLCCSGHRTCNATEHTSSVFESQRSLELSKLLFHLLNSES